MTANGNRAQNIHGTLTVETLYHFAFIRVFRGPCLELGTFNSLSALFSAVQPYSALFSVKKNIFLFFWNQSGWG